MVKKVEKKGSYVDSKESVNESRNQEDVSDFDDDSSIASIFKQSDGDDSDNVPPQIGQKRQADGK